jgi:hypothetical protein
MIMRKTLPKLRGRRVHHKRIRKMAYPYLHPPPSSPFPFAMYFIASDALYRRVGGQGERSSPLPFREGAGG